MNIATPCSIHSAFDVDVQHARYWAKAKTKQYVLQPMSARRSAVPGAGSHRMCKISPSSNPRATCSTEQKSSNILHRDVAQMLRKPKDSAMRERQKPTSSDVGWSHLDSRFRVVVPTSRRPGFALINITQPSNAHVCTEGKRVCRRDFGGERR